MGGPTGELKNKILLAMHDAYLNGYRLSVSELVELLGRKKNTISGHISDLANQRLVTELMRGQWELTKVGQLRAEELMPKRAEQLTPKQTGIRLEGFIAAGPAIPVNSGFDEIINEDFNSDTHFAMRVKGTSMVSYGIEDGDLIIFRRVNSWLEVPVGKIVAAYVPEGTDIHREDWQEQLDSVIKMYEGGQEPALDHITLKKLDVKMRSYLDQGIEQQQFDTKLVGSQGIMHPTAISVAGIAVFNMKAL